MLLQNIGITTVIVLIVSLFQQADEMLMGAALGAIMTYIFVRIKYKVFCDSWEKNIDTKQMAQKKRNIANSKNLATEERSHRR